MDAGLCCDIGNRIPLGVVMPVVNIRIMWVLMD